MKKALFLLLLIHFYAFSQQPSPDSLRKDIERSLHYLAQNQTTQTIESQQYAGEWIANMQMKGFFFLLGTKNRYRDSNCFTMTGIHALHMIIGLGIMAVIVWMAKQGRFTTTYSNPVEISGLYWHFVDLIWIFLFPLLYLIGVRS